MIDFNIASYVVLSLAPFALAYLVLAAVILRCESATPCRAVGNPFDKVES